MLGVVKIVNALKVSSKVRALFSAFREKAFKSAIYFKLRRVKSAL